MHFIYMCLREALLSGQATKKRTFFCGFPYMYMCRLSTSGAGTGLHWTCPWRTARSWRFPGAHSRGTGVIILQVISLSLSLAFLLLFNLRVFLSLSMDLEEQLGAHSRGGLKVSYLSLSISISVFPLPYRRICNYNIHSTKYTYICIWCYVCIFNFPKKVSISLIDACRQFLEEYSHYTFPKRIIKQRRNERESTNKF